MSGLADVVTGSTPGLPGASLACPAYTSNPILDLRFEELPGATSFADASLNATNATCTGNSCPAAGFSGAPNASASDYALQFDGVDDVISATTGILDSFTVAFWVKVPSGANPNGALFSHGNYLFRGWGVYLNNGAPTLVFNGSPEVLASKRVDDGEWHFVTATRDQVSGDLAIYVDGALGASKAFGRENVNAGNLLTFGTAVDIRRQAFKGQLDHVQLYRTRFTADSVKALYDRIIQSYCVVSAPGTNFANVQWGTLAIRRPDPRGGVVDASTSLKLLVDNQAPTASFEGLVLDQWLLPNTIIGGNATDVGSGVAKVEVSLDAGTTWQPATGLEAWTFRLPNLPMIVAAVSKSVRWMQWAMWVPVR